MLAFLCSSYFPCHVAANDLTVFSGELFCFLLLLLLFFEAVSGLEVQAGFLFYQGLSPCPY